MFLFRTLLRVGHAVVSPHTFRRGDVKNLEWGALVSVNSSKTRQKGYSHKIPISRSKNLSLFPVYWLEKLFNFYPGAESDFLFSTKSYPKVSYSLFNKSLKKLIDKSKMKGNFSTHSLRRGGTTSMRASGVPLSHIKERGQWVLDCVNTNIKPTLGDKLKWDKHYVR